MVSDVFALTTIHVFILRVIRGLKLNIFSFFYFNLGDDIGEDHTLGELFLSMKSPGDTYPALFDFIWLLKAFFPVQILSQMWHLISSWPWQTLWNLNFSEVRNDFPQISQTKAKLISRTVVVMRLTMLIKTPYYEKIMMESENML